MRGLRTTQRAFKRMSGELGPTLRSELASTAEPVARDARQREEQWEGASIGTIAPRIVLNGVYVTQRARKVTGKRPDFGALQMTHAFIPALEAHREEIFAGAERALDRVVRAGGF